MGGPDGRLSAAPERGGRIAYLDFLRIIAAFCVIINHTNSQIFQSSAPSAGWYASLAYFFVSKIAVPAFLMITGAVSLHKPVDWQRYPKKVLRAVLLLVVVNLFYYVLSVLTDPALSWDFDEAVKAVFIGGTHAMWYLHIYLICTLFMPFFQKLAAAMDRREERLFLLLSVLLNGTLSLLPELYTPAKTQRMYFYATVNAYIGLVFAGHYFETYIKEVRRRTAVLAGLVFLAILALELVLTKGFYDQNPAKYLQLDERTFPTVTIQTWCVFLMVKYLFRNAEKRPGLCRGVSFLGRQTLGVFLLADLGIQYLEPIYTGLIGTMPRLAAMLIYELAVFAAAMLAAILLRTIPFFRKYL